MCHLPTRRCYRSRYRGIIYADESRVLQRSSSIAHFHALPVVMYHFLRTLHILCAYIYISSLDPFDGKK
jgi:hypothetical protein